MLALLAQTVRYSSSSYEPGSTVQFLDTLTKTFAGLVIPLLVLGLLLHIAVAVYIYGAATRAMTQAEGPSLFPPLIWAFLTFFTGVVTGGVGLLLVPALFAWLHFSKSMEPDREAPWSGSRSSGRSLSTEGRQRVDRARRALREARDEGKDQPPGKGGDSPNA